MKLAYKATDDYGVVKAAALIRPLDDKGRSQIRRTLTVEVPVPGRQGGKRHRLSRSDGTLLTPA